MDNNYKFFRNKECEYFPCHEVKNDEKFNCLFCYCPLYFLEDCGGNGKFVNGIKDCSSCLIPHSENGYEYIVCKIKEVNKTKRK
ncbi:cysteine-rich small domain-containing protein [Clostridium estertheticum]|uniref:cysteine-rich small domain-containing protein n=1 Tax=Clostridium estertheticum TaxID=238834 RepID=UPI001C7D02DC|nr:cysteine-rich small domain-containing protein [Clostridium estertheticum]MBX4260668.1 cysteine-rich small domain-containing protein [Clostridium estertheticum]WLC70458.1 cysteine-rich small domain-containing protein [Clostridium estertheticum]